MSGQFHATDETSLGDGVLGGDGIVEQRRVKRSAGLAL